MEAGEPFEYAVRKVHGRDDFVKDDNGACVRRLIPELEKETCVKCPFCGLQDMDLVGMKLHILRGHCDVFDNTPV